ncbi:MAG TPA: nitrophenyl compound nitroreductase subunit ArsF family protein [Lentimicrobium sp.]|nr:nitrophenyl compound nitroreductase subunit ArsF family protein [Lentimicrobium sp.]
MKKIYPVVAILFLLELVGIFGNNAECCSANAANAGATDNLIINTTQVQIGSAIYKNEPTPKPGKIQVYYFHFERRCATCIAVEDETKKALNELYGTQMKKGDITFKSVNLEEKSGEALGNKLKVAGQSLVIVIGDKVTSDLTDKAFMYAKSEPAKLKAEIKQQIDIQLKK